MAVDVEGEELREAQLSALTEIPRKWHLPPAFSVEFVAYVVDRERRIARLREQVIPTLLKTFDNQWYSTTFFSNFTDG